MKHIAATIGKFVIGEIKKLLDNPQKEAREIRIILPSLPAPVVLLIGNDLEDYRLHMAGHGRTVKLIFKSAYALGQEWMKSGTLQDISAAEQIRKNHWYDSENHLTQWRNVQRNPAEEDALVTVLVGYELVTDQASLADFFRLDYKTLWKEILGGTFKQWIEDCLKKQVEFEDEHSDRIDELLQGLIDSSLADLTGISEFLENLDLSKAIDGREAILQVVDQLGAFKLPRMTGLERKKQKRNKSISHYLGQSVEFFNYSKYLDQGARKKALEGIEDFLLKVDEANFDPDLLGDYKSEDGDVRKSLNDFTKGLKRYIETNDGPERNRLRSADFVFLLDEVLDRKKGPGSTPPKPPKKLTGLPLEAVLRAVWITLGEFKAWANAKNILPFEELTEIQIHGDQFKSDCEGADSEELGQNSNRFLRRVIGGLDKFLEDQLAFSPDPTDPERTIKVTSSLCPAFGESALGYERAKTSEPYLKFTVTTASGAGSIKRSFIWRLPELHPYRTMASMFKWFCEQADDNPVPVFSLPHFEELMLAKDEEEVNRIIQFALQQDSGAREIFNLLAAQGIDPSDKAVQAMKLLGYEFARFIANAEENGIFSAMENFTILEKAYRDTYLTFLSDPVCKHSQVGPLLFKSFCLIGEPSHAQGNFWMWGRYEPSLVVTPMHPAFLEMLFHQHAYLCESFLTSVRQGLRDSGTKWFSERRWVDIEDLAQIQWPLHGTLRDEEMVLDTNVRSFGLFHLIGESLQKEATLSTRLLLRYDSDEDEEITDEDLFRESRESRLVERILEDYRSLNPHADDGMAIAAYCGANIQSVIAGVDAFLGNVFEKRSQDRPYTLSLTLFAESQDDTTISRWVSEWRNRWEMAEPGSKLEYYRGCRISVAHRMITREKSYEQFVGLLNSIDVDVAFLFQFIRAGASGNRFITTEPYDHSGTFRMFPILEKICCSVSGGGHEYTRERIISNRQFKLSTLHSGVMARLKHGSTTNDEYIVIGRGDFSPWIRVVDELHKRCAWVVCVDPSIDEHLIAKEDEHGKRLREIIGFGSGIGAHGEYNYTVSTEEFSFSGVKRKISAQVAGKLGPWDQQTCDKIAESITKEAAHMAGMSLVKATGRSEYVRDFMAYALVRKLLPRDPSAFCDEVISLDAFRHWFDTAPSQMRPDLMRLKANIDGGSFKISVQLIECKLAHESDRHVAKAREQLENGLGHLIACFRPRQADTLEGLDARPDQRYWWLQLHRLLASKGQVSPPELPATINALERMSDGFYSINWSAAAVTFWTDSESEEILSEGGWDFQYEGSSLPIHLISTGRQFIRNLCTEGITGHLPIDTNAGISFSSIQPEKKTLDIDVQDHEIETAKQDELEPEKNIKDRPAEEVLTGKIESRPPVTTPTDPGRIPLGQGSKGGVQFYWEFGHPELANRHLLIFGTSGMGKTYTIQALLCELAKRGQNSLIVDYTDGFHDNQLEDETISLLKPKQHVVKLSKVPVNPFRRQQEILGGQTFLEDPSDTAQRVTGVFSEVYGLGDEQWSAIYNAVKRGIELHGDKMSMSLLPEMLMEVAKEGIVVASSASSVISKIQPFVDMDPFGHEDPESWEKLFTDQISHCHILQLAGYLKEASRLITEFSLIDLYWYYRVRGKKGKPRMIVLDEIQNLDQKLESPLGKFLTEGRKFGICLIMATQTLSNFQKDEKDRLFQAAHKLFFRPAETEVKSYAQILESATNEKADVWVQRLSSLKKGECYSLGPCLTSQTDALETKAIKIRIASLPSRI